MPRWLWSHCTLQVWPDHQPDHQEVCRQHRVQDVPGNDALVLWWGEVVWRECCGVRALWCQSELICKSCSCDIMLSTRGEFWCAAIKVYPILKYGLHLWIDENGCEMNGWIMWNVHSVYLFVCVCSSRLTQCCPYRRWLTSESLSRNICPPCRGIATAGTANMEYYAAFSLQSSACLTERSPL